MKTTTRIISKEDLKIFKGKYYLPWFKKSKNEVIHITNPKKVIVFDLDETLGSFSDLYILWTGIKQVWPSCPYFYDLLDTYPEFFRYGILIILEYLYYCKIKKICHKIFIYTNNQCSSTWVKLISDYLNKKVTINFKTKHLKLFDYSICAFKINNKTIEQCRSTHTKNIKDFLNCTQLSEQANICFIDDVHYPLMKNSKVYYICPRSYIHNLRTKEIISRFIKKSYWIPDNLSLLKSDQYWRNWFQIHNHRSLPQGITDIMIDIQISQKIINHLNEFLNYQVKSSNVTNKKKRKGFKTTKKLRAINKQI